MLQVTHAEDLLIGTHVLQRICRMRHATCSKKAAGLSRIMGELERKTRAQLVVSDGVISLFVYDGMDGRRPEGGSTVDEANTVGLCKLLMLYNIFNL